MPMMIAALASTKPDAGVMATSPATAPADGNPGQRTHAGGGVGHDYRVGREAVGAQGRAAVEAEPAEPQQSGADYCQPNIVRLESLGLSPHPRSQDQGRHQGRDAGTDMDDGSTGVVEGAEVSQPAAFAPDPVSNRRINDQGPQQAEQDEGLEAFSFGEGARNECRGDNREHHLESHVGTGRDRWGIRDRVSADAAQAHEVQPTDDAPAVEVLAEGQREAE
jgi:hypothetical protein